MKQRKFFSLKNKEKISQDTPAPAVLYFLMFHLVRLPSFFLYCCYCARRETMMDLKGAAKSSKLFPDPAMITNSQLHKT